MTRVAFTIPGAYPSTLNLREHWAARAKRAKRQRLQAMLLARMSVGLTTSADIMAFGGTVILVRYAPRRLDFDNLAASMKNVVDGIADALGINDGDQRVKWGYAQEPCSKRDSRVWVEIEAARPSSAEGART